ncbi:hypothetical protein AKJ44_01230 [candidate division MSBL1 archaeon SCGC-AAA261F17]|uniref:A-type ATP synthase subunit C n=1 Tax=candidate division MSBL1 archaeon SCGC-AAA261F17 TaxID=1698274 RepID=A0A133V6Z9_9EURY|nr:hypothetical protein AKJ44_01230 [candidate division MSBL1 archaeon SCGC-AAA261F17]
MNEILILLIVLGIIGGISAFIVIRTRRIMPYVYCGARVNAWGAKLLSDSRLDELTESPGTGRILGALEDTGYQPYISDISREEGVDVEEVEGALNYCLNDTYQELIEMTPEERRDIVEKIVERINVRNLQAILTGVEKEIPKEDRMKVLTPSPTIPEDKLEMLASAGTLDRILEYLEESEYYDTLSETMEEGYAEWGVSALIWALDGFYYSNLWENIRTKKAQRSILEKMIGIELDAINIKLILRLKKEDVHPGTIAEFTVPSHLLSNEQIERMTTAEDVQSAAEVTSDTPYGPVVQGALQQFEETGSLFALEKALDEEILKMSREISLVQPFTIAPVINYLRLKETEVRNLRTIIRLKAEEVKPEDIRNALVRKREIELRPR